MRVHQATHPIATLCRVLGVSPSGYYAWSGRPASARATADAALSAQIRAIHERSRGTYGERRIHAELHELDVHVSRKRIARLMRAMGLAGVSRRKFTTTTIRDHDARPAPDLVERDFTAPGPDQLWVADITYVPTWAGFLYLAVVLDAWSRRVVGWAMATHLRTELVLDALNMAVSQRRPTNVIHHSDQGCQGEFNRSSQHLKTEVLYGKTTGVDGDVDGTAGDALAGPATDTARCGAGVLGEDRRRAVERGRGTRVWDIRSGRRAVVPGARWHAIPPAHAAVGEVPVVQ